MFVSVLLLALLPAPKDPVFPLRDGLGDYHRPVKTNVPLASKYIDQGFDTLYGFDYASARSSFAEAVKLDPNLVIGYWGIAAANGSDINNPSIGSYESKNALDAIAKARKIKAMGTPVENELIEAEAQRFSPDAPDKRAKLDQAYADAMRVVWQRHPDDPDVGAVFAESLLDVRPWNQWKLNGDPQPGTEEAVTTLWGVLKLYPLHPQGLHLLIHTLEGSKHPELALDAADRLEDLMPSIEHMQHMPAHIYNRTGNWQKAIDANTKAINVGHRLVPPKGDYIDYPHERHSLAYAAAMKGESEVAIHQVTAMFDRMSKFDIAMEASFGDYFDGMHSMFLVRFGRWAEMLDMPEPQPTYKFARIMRHEGRGVAFAAQGNIKKAVLEQNRFGYLTKSFLKARNDPDEKGALKVAEHLLSGEILVAKDQMSDAIAELKLAVEAEDASSYQEPPLWIQPTRHTLGAALLKAEKYGDAEKVYREDLEMHPHNGWALYGLFLSQQGLGQSVEASKTLEEFKKAWADSDLEIPSSCMCIKPKHPKV